MVSWDRIARGRQKPFYCVCNLWTTPWHHVLSLHCSGSSLTWSPTVRRKTWTNTQQEFAWHPVTAVSLNVKLSPLRRRVKHSTERASAPDAEHLQVLVPPKQAEDVQRLVSHWRLWMLSLKKIPFIFSCRDCAGSINPLLLWHWAAMRVQWFCGSRYWSPLIWNGKSCLPISTAKPESVSVLYETSFGFLFNNFSNSATWKFLNPALVCGRVWMFPAHSNERLGTGGCSRHRTASTTSRARLQHLTAPQC